MNLNNKFNKDGYIIIEDTNLHENNKFNETIFNINRDLKDELKKPEIKKLSGYIMGNFGIQQGEHGETLYSQVFTKEFETKLENIIGKQLSNFDIYFGGNLCLPNKGKQLFHTDGTFNQEMYMVSIATENITLNNGPTEVCKGTNNKKLKYWQFFFSKKNIEKLILKKGQISIRKHNLWHRGTKNNSSDPRLLLSYVLTPKKEKIPIKTNSDKFTIMPNFFKNNLKGRFHETIYSYFSFIIIFFKIIFSLFKRKI